MESTLSATSIEPTRQELLRLWLDRNHGSFRRLGKRLKLTGVSVARLCDGETMPTGRRQQLLDLGVPVELLPPGVDLRPGRRPKGRRPGDSSGADGNG
jgi:hypothetical protein